ncbi:MAG: signal peptidase I [Cyanobacteria bacterium Co-bin13]|nr:signal peptidase I [Cyanobacteria bacterium Co-bin13]
MTASRLRVYISTPAYKSPWAAVNLSVVMPGLGQVYGGAVAKGVAIAIAFLLLLAFSAWSIFAGNGNTLTGLWLLLPITGIYLGGLMDAYRTVTSNPVQLTLGPTAPKDPWYAVFLSQILPGLGHLYRQQVATGGLFLAIGVYTAFQANFQPHLLPLPPLIWAAACAHIYWRMTSRQPHQWSLLALILAGLVAGRLLIGYTPPLISHYLEQCIVPSSSMQPTLQVRDRLFVREDPNYQPRTFDIVVFRVTQAAVEQLLVEPDSLMVKRIVGLPGQQVEVREGQVWVNGQPLVEPYIELPTGYRWGPQTIPAEHLFVLGDNRNFSGDSHVWGFLPVQNVLGRAYKIYWPPNRIQPLA